MSGLFSSGGGVTGGPDYIYGDDGVFHRWLDQETGDVGGGPQFGQYGSRTLQNIWANAMQRTGDSGFYNPYDVHANQVGHDREAAQAFRSFGAWGDYNPRAHVYRDENEGWIQYMLLTALGAEDDGSISDPRVMSMTQDFLTMLGTSMSKGYGNENAVMFQSSEYGDVPGALTAATTNARNHAYNILTSGNYGTIKVITENLQGIITQITAKARADAVYAQASGDGVVSADMDNLAVSAKAKADPEADAVITDITELKANAQDVIDKGILEADNDIPLLLADAIGDITGDEADIDIGDMLSAATTLALNAISADVDGIIDTKTNAFEEDTRDSYMRSINADAFSYADINASNGSAFFVSMALRDNARQREINKFRADLQLEIYKMVIPEYIRAFNNAINNYLDVYKHRLQLHAQLFTGIIGEYIRVYSLIYTEYIRGYVGALSTFGNMYNTGVGVGDGMARTMHSDQVRSYMAEVDSHLNNYIRLKTHRLGARDTFTLESLNSMAKMEALRLEVLRNAVGFYDNHNKFYYTAGFEEELKDKEYEVKNALWDMGVWQQGANILASSTGDVVPVAQGPGPFHGLSLKGLLGD